MFRMYKSIKTKSRLVAAYGWERDPGGIREVIFKGYGGSFLAMKMF